MIYGEGEQVIALDARTGAAAWSIGNRGRQLRGAANDGANTALVLADAHSSLFLAVSAGGGALGSAQSEPDLGMPAARGGIAFVPWNNQYVSAIDMNSGDEAGRLLIRTQVSRGLNYGGTLYFGEQAIVRFDDKARFASTNQANHVALPKVALPGKPSWLDSGFRGVSSQADARTKIRIYAAPAQGSSAELAIASGTFAATYFRVAYGLDAQSGALRWVRALPADIVGGAAASSGFVWCDVNGKVWSVDQPRRRRR